MGKFSSPKFTPSPTPSPCTCVSSVLLVVLGVDLCLERDVVVCELAHLGVVDAEDFCFFVCAEAKARGEVHDPAYDELMAIALQQTAWGNKRTNGLGGKKTHRHDEGVAEGCARVGELVGELDPVPVEPASGYHGDSIGAGDAGLGEEPSHQITDQPSHCMGGEDLQGRKDEPLPT
jgi:hypothetical protein